MVALGFVTVALQSAIAILAFAAFLNTHRILRRSHAIMSALDDLKTAEAAEDAVIAKVITILDGIPAAITAAMNSVTSAADLEALAQHVTARTASLKQAIVDSGQDTPAPPPPPPALAITTDHLPKGSVGAAYTAALEATGGVAPYSWSVTGLPDGVALTAPPTNDVPTSLDGTPTTEGSYDVVATVTDSAAPTPASATVTLTLGIDPQA